MRVFIVFQKGLICLQLTQTRYILHRSHPTHWAHVVMAPEKQPQLLELGDQREAARELQNTLVFDAVLVSRLAS